MLAKKKESKDNVKVKIEIPIHPFGCFSFNELVFGKKKAIKVKASPIYVFPESTAALAQV
jgi:hypothetical protein